MSTPEMFSIGRILSVHAAEKGDEDAIVFVDRQGAETRMSWRELDLGSNRVARLLQTRGVGQGSMVTIGLPNSLEHVLAVFGAWKLGGMVNPASSRLPQRERDGLLEVAQPVVVIAEWDDVPGAITSLEGAAAHPADPLPDAVPHPGRAIPSGGSTGRSKLIVTPDPLAAPRGAYSAGMADMGYAPGHVLLEMLPLYHNFGNGTLMIGLFEGYKIILTERFDAAQAVDLIEKHGVTFIPIVPTMMQRILRLPDIHRRDLSSLKAIFHTAAPCPEWAKRGWIEMIGGEKVFEIYGMTEGVGVTLIRGDEWLKHPRSVGRPYRSELKVLDEQGNELPAGEVGELFLRPETNLLRPGEERSESYRYIGAEPAKGTPDGFTSVGDLGWVDDDGWVFLADRRVDMIISGGVNIFPAEVEAAISEHPKVRDVAVIGLPDEDMGKRVHAVVQPFDTSDAPGADELLEHCRERLQSAKVPRSFEFVEALPRDDAGKIRRTALVAERNG